MNHAVAVDASMAVKWVVDDPHTDRALKLWADNTTARRPIISAPDFTGEVTNACSAPWECAPRGYTS
jgi:hypothetical protein